MLDLTLLILVAIAAYGLLSRGISRTILTLPLLFTALGFGLSGALQASIPPDLAHEGKKLLAEITLILVLFSDASHVRFRTLAANWQLPARMLIVGLPLTIAFGTFVVYALSPEAGLAMALLTAALLTPTDAALGQTVVSSPDVPDRLRQTINVESGLNDGLVLPFVLVGALLAAQGTELHSGALALELVAEIVLGPLAGIAIGWGAARAMDAAQNKDLMNEAAGSVVFLATAFAAYVLAHLIGGNGFIAAFVAGMVFGNTYRHDIHFISEAMEGQGQILTMLAFLAFGAFLLPDGLAHISVMSLIVAVFFLTIVRVLPILLSLAGSELALPERVFLGWFGPRGIASILFTLLMMDAFDLPNEDELLACVSVTVALSIVLHGVSAAPLAARIGRWTGGGIN